MGLVLNIVQSSINTEGTQLNLSDSTGVYEVSDNPGGYGTPNPDREDIAIVLLPYNKRQDEGDVLLTAESFDPISASQFIVNLHKDGWYQIKSFGLRPYDVNTSFALTEATYDVVSGEIRKITEKSGSGPYTYVYEVITNVDLDSSSVITLYESTLNALVLVNLSECYINANKVFFNNANPVTNITVLCDDANFNRYEKIGAYLTSINASFGFGNYTQAQLKVEQAEKICTCIEDCNCG